MNNKNLWVLLLSFIFSLAWAEQSALVEVIHLQQKTLADTVILDGSVQTNPAQVLSIAAPIGGQIQQLFVSPGQLIQKNQPLLDFVPDASARINYQQALSSETLAKKELARIERMAQLQLATHAEVDSAKKTLQDAQVTLHEANVSGSNSRVQSMTAPFSGMVSLVAINTGDRVPLGANLLQLGRCDELIAHLGADTSDASRLAVGMPVRVHFLTGSMTDVTTKVSFISHQLNLQTGLQDIFVSVPGTCVSIIPGVFVEASIVVSSQSLWAVPQSALLKDLQGSYIYRIENGIAKRIPVIPVITDHGWVGIQAKTLNNQDLIVTLGNYELENDMHVRIAPL
jgi:RND family efflux transporter MFP subunit